MLSTRPSSSVLTVSDGQYGYSKSDDRPYLYLKSLQDIKASLDHVPESDDQPLNDNGKRTAAWVEAAKVRQGLHAKKPKKDISDFKTIISHTIYLQPFKTPTSSDLTVDDLPEVFELVLDPGYGRISIQYGEVKLGRLVTDEMPWFSAALGCRSGKRASVNVTCTSKSGVYGSFDEDAEDEPHNLHFEILVEVAVNVTKLVANDSHRMKELLRFAFLRNHEGSPLGAIERLSGLNYTGTDLDWFYACLCRPGLGSPLDSQSADRKGKGQAVNQDIVAEEEILDIDGLVPTLHPFQRKSLKWLLRREGKEIVGRDKNDRHRIEDIPEDDPILQQHARTFWMQFELDDYKAWLNVVDCTISEAEPVVPRDEDEFEGSIIAEEMGLGKTVEVLALIRLNKEPKRSKQASYYNESLTCTVQPSGITLIVCPKAIVSQWQDEIERHTPGLKVLRYDGIKDKAGKYWAENPERVVQEYNVLLCTFDVFTAEVRYARKPRIFNTRGKKDLADEDKVNYTRSLLIAIDFLRVVIDEAQMASSTTSAISELASLIPRKYSLAVSGTPIKQTIKDLAGLLKFLRVRDYGYNKKQFDWLISPDGAVAFTRLVSSIGIRSTKAQVANELNLPTQTRYIAPVEFTAVELYNYQQRYKDAVHALQVGLDIDAVTKDWYLSAQNMVSWLHLLRQACFHAQARQVQAKKTQKPGQRLNEAQTLDEFGRHLREANITELHLSQRKAAESKIQRAYRLMYDKEECERFETALKLLSGARRDLKLLCQDIHSEMLLVLPEARGSRASSSGSDSNADEMSFLEAFRETVKEAIDKVKEREDDDASQIGKRATALSGRLREVAHVLHQAVFFSGNAYFAMGNKPDEEAAMYREAERIRKQVLLSAEQQALRLMEKMHDRTKSKPLTADILAVELSNDKPGLQTGRIFDTIEEIAEEADTIAELMLKWRSTVIDILSTKLADDDVSGEEYQKNAEKQEQVNVYLEYLGLIQSDWIQLVTGVKSSLAASVELADSKAEKELESVGVNLAGKSRRSMFKRRPGISTSQAKAILAAADPATAIRIELGQERKKALPAERLKAGISLSGQKRELSNLKDRLIREEEVRIIDRELLRLRKFGQDVDKLIDQMRSETALFTEVYNARVNYFKQMQEFSDSVAELAAKDATPFALQWSIRQLRTSEAEHERAVVGQLSRRRFIDQKINAVPDRDEELCLICSDTEGGQRVVTSCVHLFHWDCLNRWFAAGLHRTCPVCRSSLNAPRSVIKISDEVSNQLSADKGKQRDASPIVQATAAAAAGPSSMKIEEIDDAGEMDGVAEKEEAIDMQSKFNYLHADEVELIKDVPLRGAALGSKLDFITKHVLHLREKHQRAIAAFYADEGGMDKSEKAPTEAKILIYSGWQYACDVLAQALERERIGYVRLETAGKGRKESAVIDFKENPDIAVFILHAQSQAAGLNLISAQYVMLVEPLMQPALELQAIARVHRIGQTQNTTVFQYVVNDTVDERIALLSLEAKNHRLFAKEQASIYALLENSGEDGKAIDLGATAAIPTGSGPTTKKKGDDPLRSADSNADLTTTHQGREQVAQVLFERLDHQNAQRLALRAEQLRVKAKADAARAAQAEREELRRALAESARMAQARHGSRAGSDASRALMYVDSSSDVDDDSVLVATSRDRLLDVQQPMELSSDTEQSTA